MKFFIMILLIISTLNTYSYEVYSLYTTKKPYRIGDIITIRIDEKADASNSAQTSTTATGSQDASAHAGTGIFKFLPGYGVDSKQNSNYKGNGSTSKKGNLEALISAQITKVLDNGNLLISGTKEVKINNEKEIISISGAVRPYDILHDNSIYSYKIYNAKISYSGNGVVNSAQKPGILTRFFNWLF